MTLQITLPDELSTQLEQKAETKQLSIEELAVQMLWKALDAERPILPIPDANDDFPTPEEVVARIKAMPPNPKMIRPAEGSLANALRSLPHDPDFNLETWEREWVKVEAEIKAITRANDIAEGRG